MRGFEQDIQFLKGVGPKRAELYHKLGIETVRDLLTHYPRSYVNFADTVRIFALSETEPGAVRATVLRKGAAQRVSGGRMLYKAAASDGFTNFEVVFFGNAYAFDALIEGEDYVFYGKASRGGGRYQDGGLQCGANCRKGIGLDVRPAAGCAARLPWALPPLVCAAQHSFPGK